MTSPRQRKKRLALFKAKQKQEELVKQNTVVTTKQVEIKKEGPAKPVEAPTPPVVESEAKPKKPKNALVETKSQEQVVEQTKPEVKTETKG